MVTVSILEAWKKAPRSLNYTSNQLSAFSLLQSQSVCLSARSVNPPARSLL